MRTTPVDRIADFTDRGWWEDATAISLFDQAVADRPQCIALVDPFNRADFASGAAQRLTFAEVASRVDNLAATLHAHDIGQDDKVVIQLPNTVELPILYLALARLGVIVSPVPVQYSLHELAKIQEELQPKAYISATLFKGAEFAASRQAAFSKECKILVFGEGSPDGAINIDLKEPGDARRQLLATYLKSISVSANDIFTIGWTSGTTGEPKGVPRTHNMWRASALISYEAVQFNQDDVLLNPHQLVNPASIAAFFFNWLMCQGTLVLHHPLDLQIYLKQIELENVTYTVAPPAVLTKLLKDPLLISSMNLSSLRFIGSGGAALSRWMVVEFQKRFDIPVINMYGSNEGAALISSYQDVPSPEARAENFPRFGVKDLVWSNRSSEQMRTKLVDIESGEEVTKPGKAGELLIWGAAVFDGYYNSPEANESVFSKDGYFHTGDMFEIAGDKDKPLFYRFVGRCKDIIVRGGMKITPDELDNLLAGHPKIVEVAVVGYADEVLEERVCAVAVPKLDERLTLEDIIEFLKEKNVAVFKLPEKLLLVDQLPRNPSGKVLRYQLKELAE